MEQHDVIKKVDHTLLSPAATWTEIAALIDEGIAFGAASVCIPPCFVKQAKAYAGDRLPICTVIGFPNGYQTQKTKEFEARDAIENGADELDMVISIGALKEGRYPEVLGEIQAIKAVCGEKVLKVIIETCLLTREEKIKMCEIVTESGADYIKTSTGFSTSGATREDVSLLAKHVGAEVKVKAAGGIRSFADATDYLNLGASRLGTSQIIRLAKQEGENGQESSDSRGY